MKFAGWFLDNSLENLRVCRLLALEKKALKMEKGACKIFRKALYDKTRVFMLWRQKEDVVEFW